MEQEKQSSMTNGEEEKEVLDPAASHLVETAQILNIAFDRMLGFMLVMSRDIEELKEIAEPYKKKRGNKNAE